jgi:glycosyltransferase involved in cell wall biosynthesis
MHVLIIPSEHFLTKKLPLAGIFQFEQASALIRSGFDVGILSVGFIGLRNAFSMYPYNRHEYINKLIVYRSYIRNYIPFRIFPYEYVENKCVNLFIRDFDKYIETNGVPDIIHAHNLLHAGILARYIKKNYKIPFVLTEHSSAFARDSMPMSYNEGFKRICLESDGVTCVSSTFKKLLDNRLGCEFKILHNIVDPIFFSGNLNARTSDIFTFLSVASLDKNKNQALALRAFAKSFSGQRVEFRIAGDGPLRNSLQKLAFELKIHDQVKFLGRLSREAVSKEMLNANCFVLTSNYETFGVVLIEALACGIPLIATRCGGPEDIVNDSNGILVDVGDLELLSMALCNMYSTYSKYSSHNLRQEALERFGEKSFVNNVAMLYKQALNYNK